MATGLVLKVGLFFLSILVLTSAKTYYVTSSSSTPCPEEGIPCFTLSQYANKSGNYFASNATLILLPGSHSLDSELTVQNISFLSIDSKSHTERPIVITCHQSARFIFEWIGVVTIRGLALFGCVNNEVTKVEELTVEDCSFDGQGKNGTGLHLVEVITANITKSSFSFNTGRNIKHVYRPLKHKVGGAIIAVNSTLEISNCAIENNTVTGKLAEGGAMYIEFSFITIINSTLNMNTVTGSDGWGGALSAYGHPNITIINSTLNKNTITGSDGWGGALNAYNHPNITIINSTLNKNTITGHGGTGGALNVCDYPNITIINSILNKNSVIGHSGWGGVLYAYDHPNIAIVNSGLNSNSVSGDSGNGGALSADVYAIITIINSTLSKNSVTGNIGTGGVLSAYDHPNITIINSTLNNNSVDGGSGKGGALSATVYLNITIINSTLNNNTVTGYDGKGGALSADINPTIAIINSIFNNNTVSGYSGKGGAFSADNSPNITLINSTFNNNVVIGDGGVGGALSAMSCPNITVVNCMLSNNKVTESGSVFHFISVTFTSSGHLHIQSNKGNKGVFYAVKSTLHISGKTTVSHNNGSLFVYFCNMTLMGHIDIVSNSYSASSSEEGGAITAFQSEIVFTGTVNLVYNRAIQGGGIKAIESKLYNYGNIIISHNAVSESGGGIYAHQSELNFKNNTNISSNTATSRGGGIHASSSTIRLTNGSKTNIVGNHAKRGGGICIQGTTRVYLLKSTQECGLMVTVSSTSYVCSKPLWTSLYLKSNFADNYGGAVYVDDATSSAGCNGDPYSDSKATLFLNECFLQGVRLYSHSKKYDTLGGQRSANILNTYFIDNRATEAGDALYGGLLDRCGASQFSEIYLKNEILGSQSLDGINYLATITNLKLQEVINSTRTISSDPVRVCFCQDNQPDCSFRPQPVFVRRGERFTVSVVAVDHINNTKPNSTIHSYVSTEAGLGEGQSIQMTNEGCTNLTYSIFSQLNYEKLHVKLYLYADGPCMKAGISRATLNVNIEACPIGFKDTDSHCKCDPIIYPEYISNCSIDRETVQRKDNVWFTYVNTSDHQGYILHQHCPFDYCRSPAENISVNLNIENGANKLCAFNRSGKLCGSCEDGLSLSLGTSSCRQCSNNWLALIIVFALAGVALVAFLLKLNFTVAEGTLNGLILYANIFAANRAIFFPHDKTTLLTVFIAWLNLDFGFETCFYDGMDGYIKTWLQLAFPLYVISLVVAIIIVSDYSSKFARLFYGRNTLPTLATLILLSYTKLLRTIIASLSFTTLEYSDSSREVVWLVDANIPYLSEKHIPLFTTAIIIVIIGLVYTFILFTWQWLVHCPNRGPLRWIIGSTKVISIMDAYHHPYNKDHRYWIGLLLLVRVVLYLVSALNVYGDPRINLCSIAVTIGIILALKNVVESKRKVLKKGQSFCNTSDLQLTRIITTVLSRKVHKNQNKEILEISYLLNLAGLSIVSFITYNKNSQNIAAYISAGIAFATFLAIFGYHVYKSVFVELFHKIESKYYQEHRPPRQPQVEMYSPVALDGEPDWGSVTEVEAPVPMDTISDIEDEQLSVQEDNNIEQDEINTDGDSSVSINQFCSSAFPKSLIVISSSHSSNKPLKKHDRTLNAGKSSEFSLIATNTQPHTPALYNENTTPIDIEMCNAVSGHDCSAVAKTSLLEDKSQSEDENAPLLNTTKTVMI